MIDHDETFAQATSDLTRQHVLAAMDELGPDPALWPRRSDSTGYDILDPRTEMRFPPKLVLETAIKLSGHHRPRSKFSGGDETNDVLRRLGFEIQPKHERLKP